MKPFDRTPTGCTDEYKSPQIINFTEDPIVLRLYEDAWGEPDECFYMEVPAEFGQKSIRELLDYALPNNEAAQNAHKEELDVEEDMSLPEKYDYFIEVREDERNGKCAVDYSANLGKVHLNLDDKVESHLGLSTYEGESFKTLHLITEQYNMPFTEYQNAEDLAKDKREFMGLFFAYMVDQEAVKSLRDDQIRGPVKDALDWCTTENLLTTTKGASGLTLKITDQGVRYIQENVQAEVDWYTEQYEIFQNVLVDGDDVDFEPGDNEFARDLRITAIRYDSKEMPGLNPYRYVMLTRIFAEDFAEVKDTWEEEMHSENFFPRWLGIAGESNTDLTTSELDLVMTLGKEINEEHASKGK